MIEALDNCRVPGGHAHQVVRPVLPRALSNKLWKLSHLTSTPLIELFHAVYQVTSWLPKRAPVPACPPDRNLNTRPDGTRVRAAILCVCVRARALRHTHMPLNSDGAGRRCEVYRSFFMPATRLTMPNASAPARRTAW